MGTVISNLKAKFGVDSSDFKKGLKDGDRAVDEFKGSAGSKLDEFASMFGVNMGAVNGSINTANKSLNFFGQSLRGAAKGGNLLTISMKALKIALISTGIGALVVALGSLITYFKGTGEGALKFAGIMSKIRSVIDNIIDRFQNFGAGLADIFSGNFREGWEKMKTAFKGIGDEITKDWVASGKLADREDALYKKETALTVSLSERRTKMEELRLAARDLNLTEQEQLEAQKGAMEVRRSMMNDELGIEVERLAIMKERLAISASDPTNEQLREIAEQEARVNQVRASGTREIKTMAEYYNTLTRKVEKLHAAEKERATIIAITKAEIDNLAFPDFGKAVENALAPMPTFQKQIKETMVDISDSINGAFESMASGLGEFLGALAIGDAGIKDFGKMMASAFADLAVTVGKIVIKAALAMAGIDKALKMPGAWPVALAAGVALVAIGSVVRGALANAASGSGSANLSLRSNTYTYDTRATAATTKMELSIAGKLTAEGSDLVYVFNNENNRKNLVT